MILDRYYKYLDDLEKRKNNTTPEINLSAQNRLSSHNEPSTKSELEHQDHLMALQLQREESKGSRLSTRTKPAKSGRSPKVLKRRTSSRPAPNTPFNAPLALSQPLLELLGAIHLSRPQVVKQLWVYIKKHELQDENNKRRVLCDEKLQAVFKKKAVDMFEMNRLLGLHLYKTDELIRDGSGNRSNDGSHFNTAPGFNDDDHTTGKPEEDNNSLPNQYESMREEYGTYVKLEAIEPNGGGSVKDLRVADRDSVSIGFEDSEVSDVDE